MQLTREQTDKLYELTAGRMISGELRELLAEIHDELVAEPQNELLRRAYLQVLAQWEEKHAGLLQPDTVLELAMQPLKEIAGRKGKILERLASAFGCVTMGLLLVLMVAEKQQLFTIQRGIFVAVCLALVTGAVTVYRNHCHNIIRQRFTEIFRERFKEELAGWQLPPKGV